jgi:hypothetical protein
MLMMIIIKAFDQLQQRAPPGAPRATSGPRQIVTRSAKLFANLLLVTTSSFIFFFPKHLKKSFLSRLLFYVLALPHTLLSLKPNRKM